MHLSPLYHWSPAERYDVIRREGLRPGSTPVVCSNALEYICLALEPRIAWQLSGAMEWANEIEYWDLWLADIGAHDELHVRSEFGPDIWEVKCRTPIPPDRLWWIGRRYELGVPGRDMQK